MLVPSAAMIVLYSTLTGWRRTDAWGSFLTASHRSPPPSSLLLPSCLLLIVSFFSSYCDALLPSVSIAGRSFPFPTRQLVDVIIRTRHWNKYLLSFSYAHAPSTIHVHADIYLCLPNAPSITFAPSLSLSPELCTDPSIIIPHHLERLTPSRPRLAASLPASHHQLIRTSTNIRNQKKESSTTLDHRCHYQHPSYYISSFPCHLKTNSAVMQPRHAGFSAYGLFSP